MARLSRAGKGDINRMNKKTIRAIAIVMAILAVVTLAFTGCGKKKDKETTTKPQVTVSSTETTTEEATVRHVQQTRRRANITATQAITETTRVRPTGTTAASIIKDGAAGAADEDPGQTW